MPDTLVKKKGKSAMTETNQLITIIPGIRIGDFKVEPDNVMLLPGIELIKPENPKTHEPQTRLDQGNLEISRKNLAFTGSSASMSFPLSSVTRVQPYEMAIDIYEKDRKEPYQFVWGNKISMKAIGIPGDDGKIKPLSGRIVAQFIINERSRVGNLLRPK
jgi:hypothetical protein